MRVPGILAGLKDRSQSAYAAPAPKPVERAIGHVRPEKKINVLERCKEYRTYFGTVQQTPVRQQKTRDH
jgi:hypothetical protein